jgi:TatD DNase family protein
VKGRNEPSAIGAVAWVVHKVKEEASFQEFVDQDWKNAVELVGLAVNSTEHIGTSQRET